MIKTLALQVQFHNVPVHSEQQLQAFTDRLRDLNKAMHPGRKFDNDVAVYLIGCTEITPEKAAKASAKA